MHLADRILGLTHHFLGHQPIAKEFTERALRQPHLLDPTSGMDYQVETPVAMRAQLARILWLMGFPDQAKNAAKQAVEAALDSGRSYPISYALIFGTLPVALWSGDVREARRQLDLLSIQAVGNQSMERWRLYFARVLRLQEGNEDEALIASSLQSPAVPAVVPPFADLPLEANIEVPLPRAELDGVLWNTSEVLRVNASLLLWHNTPGAAAAADANLLRALEIAREQTALSWELRAAISLARLWRGQGRAAEALDLLASTYAKFTEGLDTSDLVCARSLMTELESDQPLA
jgi:hypothetical protein